MWKDHIVPNQYDNDYYYNIAPNSALYSGRAIAQLHCYHPQCIKSRCIVNSLPQSVFLFVKKKSFSYEDLLRAGSAHILCQSKIGHKLKK